MMPKKRPHSKKSSDVMPRLGKEMKVTIPPPTIIDHPMNIIIDEIILNAPYF